MFESFIKKLKLQLQEPLPGKLAQLKMAPEIRKDSLLQEKNIPENAKKAAVLICFYLKNNETHIALIKRIVDGGVHSGQIAFPGGRWEQSDTSLMETALREAEEEVNILKTNVTVLGCLTELYIPPSNFMILPVVGFTNIYPNFKPEIAEVQQIVEAPLKALQNPENRKEIQLTNLNGSIFSAPSYHIENETIWGATAMVISELNEVIKF